MKLPDLPEYARGPTIDGIQYKSPGLSKMQLRAIQRAAAIWALEEAAKVCKARQTPGTGSVAILRGAAAAILALKGEIE